MTLRFTSAILIAALLVGFVPAAAQGDVHGYADYILNVRSGPDVTFDIVGEIQPGTGMVFEARNADASWLLGHTVDGAVRGWVASLYFSYEPGFTATRLPTSEETIVAPAPAALAAAPDSGGNDQAAPPAAASHTLDLAAVPVISPRVHEIFLRGQELGNNPHVFTKVGDCNSASERYLSHLFAWDKYDLGQYGYLQGAIDHFAAGGSFLNVNFASTPGFNILMAMDATYADPSICGGRSPLACDFDRLHPSVVFINQNMADVMSLSPADYRIGLRNTIDFALEKGVIPVLVTFPLYARAEETNNIMRALAAEYGLPLVDFSNAAGALPDRGMEAGGDGNRIHLSGRDSIDFSGEQKVYGFTLLDLLTLQTLERLRAVMG